MEKPGSSTVGTRVFVGVEGAPHVSEGLVRQAAT